MTPLLSRLTRRALSLRRSVLLPHRSTTHAPSSSISRGFASRAYMGDMSNALRFDLAHPAGGSLKPRDFRGRPVLVVNTASQCSLSPQLRALQQLYETYSERGLEIVAVPCNDFDRREPGSDEEIAMVYTAPDGAFRVTFPIAKKSEATGEKAHEFFSRVVYKYGRSVAPTWNFDKFLVDAYGDLTAVFPHDSDPLLPEVHEAIEDALNEMPTAGDDDEDDEEDSDDECDTDSDDEDSTGSDSDADESGSDSDSEDERPLRRR